MKQKETMEETGKVNSLKKINKINKLLVTLIMRQSTNY